MYGKQGVLENLKNQEDERKRKQETCFDPAIEQNHISVKLLHDLNKCFISEVQG